ncbi:MAG: SprT-like domain-containing protein [Ferruginibacter sp.]
MEQQSLQQQPGESPDNSSNVPYGTQPIVRIVGKYTEPTLRLFGSLYKCAEFFQQRLFARPLSPYFLSLNKTQAKGYNRPNSWQEGSIATLPEININPDLLLLSAEELMGTLLHEICHHYHAQYGSPGKNGYHNKEFSNIMSSIGLQCSETGRPGGKDTGYKMTHYIIHGGKFDRVFKELPQLLLTEFKPVADSASKIVDPKKLTKQKLRAEQKRKTKYTCLGCSLCMWGKPSAYVICGNCQEQLVILEDFGK